MMKPFSASPSIWASSIAWPPGWLKTDSSGSLKKWRYCPRHLSLSRLLPHGRSGCAGGETPFSPGPSAVAGRRLYFRISQPSGKSLAGGGGAKRRGRILENFTRRSQTWLELQWRPVAGRWIRPDQEPKAEELLARSIPIPGSAVRLLAPEDNLLQIALHTAKHSYVRAPGFRLHTDVDRIVRRQPLNWEVFLTRVISLEVKTRSIFPWPFPGSSSEPPSRTRFLAQLQPPAWKIALITSWLQRVGLFNPDAPKFGRAGFVFFTALLYDDLKGLLRGLFPGKAWMRAQYRFHAVGSCRIITVAGWWIWRYTESLLEISTN